MSISVAEVAGTSFIVKHKETGDKLPVFDVRYVGNTIYFLTYQNKKWVLVDAEEYGYFVDVYKE